MYSANVKDSENDAEIITTCDTSLNSLAHVSYLCYELKVEINSLLCFSSAAMNKNEFQLYTMIISRRSMMRNNRKWIQMPAFPFHPDLYSFSSYRSLTVNDAVFIFGGWVNGLPLADVATFENNIWYKMTDIAGVVI